MNPHELYRFYTEKKEEAEKVAASTADEDLRARWLSIAEGYRILAAGHKAGRQSVGDEAKNRRR